MFSQVLTVIGSTKTKSVMLYHRIAHNPSESTLENDSYKVQFFDTPNVSDKKLSHFIFIGIRHRPGPKIN